MNSEQVSIEITIKEMKQMINSIYGKKISLNIQGTVGIGKSIGVFEKAKQLAKAEGREFIDWNRSNGKIKDQVVENPEKYFIFFDNRLSQYDATDLKGIPNVKNQQYLQWLKEKWIMILSDERTRAVVFFDEMNLAPPSVLASAYQFIRDRCVGEVKINDHICILSAGNTLEDRANVTDIPKPLCNRFIHATLLPPSVEEWSEWALKNGVDNRIITYLNYKHDHLFNFNVESPENAFPTPRSWSEYVSPLIKEKSHREPLFFKLVASAIGTGIATTFKAFLEVRDTINFDDILKNPQEVENITKINMQYSLVSLICQWLEKNHKKDDMDKLIEIMQYQNPEFAILTLKMVVNNYMKQVEKYFPQNKIWKKKLSLEYAKYLR
jgi:hypothetical protein